MNLCRKHMRRLPWQNQLPLLLDSRKSSTIKFEVYTTSLSEKNFKIISKVGTMNEYIILQNIQLGTYYSQMQKNILALSWYYWNVLQRFSFEQKLQESRFDVLLCFPVVSCWLGYLTSLLWKLCTSFWQYT
jgi:hypothetical protein